MAKISLKVLLFVRQKKTLAKLLYFSCKKTVGTASLSHELHIRLKFQKELNNACVIDEVNFFHLVCVYFKLKKIHVYLLQGQRQ